MVIKVAAVYRAGVVDPSEFNSSPYTQTIFLQAKDKNTQRESRKMTYLKTMHVVCMNSDIHITKVYTQSSQKSH